MPLSSALALMLRMMVMPSTGLPLRSSVHLSQTSSTLVAGSRNFSIVPVNTPLVSLMRTRDFSFLVSSSIVFHTPTGDTCARADAENATNKIAANDRFMLESPRFFKMTDGRAQASASSVSIKTLAPARAVRISVAVSGNSLAK
ncbi:MAG: hypothetical protein BWX79_00073 [Alphaproteobacteria bacterium ADurb.Bin100]|nr:MAG: hypothetical protein BWX79_00073 [Alphaproteobacteria bacterium ADurb.Bin100]